MPGRLTSPKVGPGSFGVREQPLDDVGRDGFGFFLDPAEVRSLRRRQGDVGAEGDLVAARSVLDELVVPARRGAKLVALEVDQAVAPLRKSPE